MKSTPTDCLILSSVLVLLHDLADMPRENIVDNIEKQSGRLIDYIFSN